MTGFKGISFVIICSALILTEATALPYLPGWPVEVGAVHFSSPAVADIDGDGEREVAFAAWDDGLYLVSADGSVHPGFPFNTWKTEGEGEDTSPVLADVDDDGVLEVIFLSNEGKLISLSTDGKMLSGWPKELEGLPDRASPVVQNLTDYRGLEVIAAVESATGVRVYAFHYDGTAVSGWPVEIENGRSPYVAVGDVDGDNAADVIVAAGERVWAFYYDGTPMDGWPVEKTAKTFGPPAIAKLERGGADLVLFGASDGYGYAVDARGRLQAGWPVKLGNSPISTGPAFADLDGDGTVEVVFEAGGPHLSSSFVYAVDVRGRVVQGFPVTLNEPTAAAPITADVDGDGLPEIVIATCKGNIWAFGESGEVTQGYPITVSGGKITSTPTATDLDGDGELDIITVSDAGYLEAVRIGSPYNPDASPWPTYGGNHWRSGKYLTRKTDVLDFDVRAGSGNLSITWESPPSSKRNGWSILRAQKEDCLPGNYKELAEIPQELSGYYSYKDKDIEEAEVYYYILEERLTDGGAIKYGPKIVKAPKIYASDVSETKILNAYPNPFHTTLKIPFQLGEDVSGTGYTVKVFDLSGKVVKTLADGQATAGEFELTWDALDDRGNPVANGVYVIRLSADDKRVVFSKSIILARTE